MAEPLVVLDRYEVLRHLASGGMGDIYLARQRGRAGFERLVVLKSLRPNLAQDADALALFLNEARAAARMNHPNVVQIYEVDEDRGVFFIAMELIEGSDLKQLSQWLRAGKQRLPFRIAAHLVADAARGLHHAHTVGQGILHRDVSPSNVMARLDGVAKVVDFGIAAARGRAERRDRGGHLGKLRYASPEQIERAPLDPRADQFSLGVVLWELLAGRRAFADATPAEIRAAILGGRIAAPRALEPAVPEALDQICRRMLAPRPEGRFSSCAAVAEALQAFLDNTGGAAGAAAGKLVTLLAGRSVAALRADTAPRPVQIPGLLPRATAGCPACGYDNPLRNLYCGACGASLSASKAPAPPPAARPRGLDLSAEARALASDGAASAEPVRLIAGRLDAEGVEDLQAILREAAVDVTPLRQTRGELLWALDEPVDEALARAADLLERLERRGARATLVVHTGPATIRDARPEGPPLEAARRLATLAFDLGHAGLFASDAARAQARRWRVVPIELHRPGPHPELETLYRVDRTPRPKSTPGRALALVGRAELWLALQDAVAEALSRRGGGAAIVGLPGSGKTAVLEAAAADIEAEGGWALWLPGPEGGERALAAALVRAVCEALELPGRDLGEAAQLDALGLEPACVALLLGPATSVVQAGLTTAQALTRLLVAASRRRPWVIFADDVHRAPPERRALLWTLADGCRIARAAVVVTADPSAAAELPSSLEPLALGPMPDAQLLEVVGRHLAEHTARPPRIADALARLVLSRAEGRPGPAVFVAQSLRAAGALEPSPEGWRLAPGAGTRELARTDEALLEAQVRALSPAARDLLELVALAEAPVAPEALWAAHAGGPAAAPPAAWAELAAQGWLRTAPARLTHPSRAAAWAARLSPERRASLHHRLAEAFGRAPDADPLRVARHRYEAGARGAALLQDLLPAAERLRDPDAPLPLVRATHEALTDSLEAGRLLDPHTARDLHRLARAVAARLAQVDLPGAHALLDVIEAHVPADLDPEGRLLAHVERAEIALRDSNLERARRDVEAADRLARRHDVEAGRWARLRLGAELLEAQGDLRGAATRLDAALAHEAPRAPWDEATLANTLGRLALRLGELERARALLTSAAEAARAAGLPVLAARADLNLGAALARGHDLDGAREALERALEAATEAGDAIEESRAAHNLGRVLAAGGEAGRAAQAYDRATAAARRVGWSEGLSAATAAQRSSRS